MSNTMYDCINFIKNASRHGKIAPGSAMKLNIRLRTKTWTGLAPGSRPLYNVQYACFKGSGTTECEWRNKIVIISVKILWIKNNKARVYLLPVYTYLMKGDVLYCKCKEKELPGVEVRLSCFTVQLYLLQLHISTVYM